MKNEGTVSAEIDSIKISRNAILVTAGLLLMFILGIAAKDFIFQSKAEGIKIINVKAPPEATALLNENNISSCRGTVCYKTIQKNINTTECYVEIGRFIPQFNESPACYLSNGIMTSLQCKEIDGKTTCIGNPRVKRMTEPDDVTSILGYDEFRESCCVISSYRQGKASYKCYDNNTFGTCVNLMFRPGEYNKTNDTDDTEV